MSYRRCMARIALHAAARRHVRRRAHAPVHGPLCASTMSGVTFLYAGAAIVGGVAAVARWITCVPRKSDPMMGRTSARGRCNENLRARGSNFTCDATTAAAHAPVACLHQRLCACSVLTAAPCAACGPRAARAPCTMFAARSCAALGAPDDAGAGGTDMHAYQRRALWAAERPWRRCSPRAVCMQFETLKMATPAAKRA